jgi:DNA replication licensing factor MCM2
VHKATDNEELLAFLLGQLIKEKVQIALHQTGREPEKITVPYSQLEARVSRVIFLSELSC